MDADQRNLSALPLHSSTPHPHHSRATHAALDLMIEAVDGEHDFPVGTSFMPTDVPWFTGNFTDYPGPVVFVNADGSWLFWEAS